MKEPRAKSKSKSNSRSNSNSNDFADIADAVCERLAKNQRVRRTLPGDGRLRFDRQLPFLCLYRRPPGPDDAGTQELVTSEAAYLFASGKKKYHESLNALCQRIDATMQEHFGMFLILEVWAEELDESLPQLTPAFTVVTPELENLPSTIDVFTQSLAEIAVHDAHAVVTTRFTKQVAPPGLQPLTHACPEKGRGGCFVLGLAVRPIYRDRQTGVLFPMILNLLRSQLARALRKAISQFTGYGSGANGMHYESLGPSSFVKAARLIDQQLCEVSESFDFLLQVTPTNIDDAWQQFKDGGYREAPVMCYRPLPYHPHLLKRRLFSIEIERIEDPSLAHLFWEKQAEIGRELTALRDLDTPHFLWSSLQLFGSPDDSLVELARDILAQSPPALAAAEETEYLSVNEIVQRAREEFDHYHLLMHEFNATLEVCNHIASGFMVSHGRLLIADNMRITGRRLEPLLHHEIGTHLLTYFNGRCQPFRQLYAGLAGCDELQEGLAVLAEYLCGGLTWKRLRNLAGRVMAARWMTDRLPFVETFARLREECGMGPRRAYITAVRAYRGGGLTKDIIYLRGFRDLLGYLASGHDIEPLYVGKLGLHHLPYVQEMRRRGIIDAPAALPRFWKGPEFRDRLEACRNRSIIQLMETSR